MAAGSITRMLAGSSEIILRWSDTPLGPAQESLVELVHPDGVEPLIRAPFRIGEQTPVTLVAQGYMVNGIVRFCRADKQSYLITVSTCGILEEQAEAAHFRDPGALAVDDFLTEEEEAKILESLQGLFRTLIVVPPTPFVVRAARQLWSYTAALFAIPSAARPGCTWC